MCLEALPNLQDRAYYESRFFNWMKEHNVKATSGQHFVQMIQNFANNDDLITEANNKNLSYKLGHNQFSGMDVEEWKSYVKLGLKQPESTTPGAPFVSNPNFTAAETFDWRDQNAVSAVKDQGQCGSCWSFSAVAALETAQFIKSGKKTLTVYSEQNLVSCDTKDSGCNGGLMDTAFDWIQSNKGICTSAAYPYTSGTTKVDGTCNTSCAKDSAAAVTGHVDLFTKKLLKLTPATDAQLVEAVNTNGVVSVAIQADESAFQLYKSGTFTGKCGAKLDHGVAVVGYTKDAYIVRNSWGASWGDNGYIYLARGDYNDGYGQCGVLSEPSFPTL